MITLKLPTADVPLDVQDFTCREGVSQLFELSILASAPRDAKSGPGLLTFDAVLGKSATVVVDLPGGDHRFFNGIVASVEEGGVTVSAGPFAKVPYRLEIVPNLWLLGRRTQSRIFQHVTVPDILEQVLTGLDVRFELNGTYEPRDYCTQYRETDLAFASRLMEEEGMFYFFEHKDGAHTLVVGDTPQGHPTLPTGATIKFEPLTGGTRTDDRIQLWEKRQTITSGKVTLWDHTFELPHKNLSADAAVVDSVTAGKVTHKLHLSVSDKLELYDYPGEYAQRFSGTAPGGGDRPADVQKIFQDNARTAKIRARQMDSGAVVIRGMSNCRNLASGFRFTLTNHANGDGDYLLLTVTHVGRVEATPPTGGPAGAAPPQNYENTFTCVPAAVVHRPPRLTPRPFVHGCQTATVVGPAGEEIFTDKYGRVKVQFHWDRAGKNDANSSGWLRVSTSWAGQQWGAIHIPRIGQEVVVDFLEGDPDRPIIIGSVYNAEQMPPYALPANKTQSGVKSRSSLKGTAANFNEIRFEDKKGSEQLFIHAEKNQDIEVENDETQWVGRDQTVKIDRDRTENVGRNETITIGGNRTESVGKAESISVADGQTVSIGKDQSIDVGANRTVTVAKDQTTDIGEELKTTIGKNEEHTVGEARTTSVAKDDKLDVGKKLLVQAADEIVFKTGDATITMKKDGTIKIEGKDVTIDGSGKINVKASSDVVVKGSKVAMN
ncbi:type VI secretion system Vgr family protein (plasmid) [Gemmatirosa kalamazoonensis]|uniref:Type VI secretion system Vgr family protein n=1 Tax=Gemmatirosa kalamazoonensis TaxID=861299 RepID=W0RRP4_9BACT|nr:type VI secretion system tip protein TssI/VgrG [Gemmatirosa kalamazoonensis]AHG92995.1 type VI secretion system Vgr family protein [Gemmatirosa kalamazoonensis]